MGQLGRKISRRLSRLADRRRKWLWLVHNRSSGSARPIFITGSQRSGTGMLGECLGKSPEFENLGESDSRAFSSYFIRDDKTIGRLLAECRYRFVVFKPLKDSHRLHHLLSLDPAGKAFWAYRNYLDRINSAVKKFGRHPLDVIASFSSGNRGNWQMLGISGQDEQVVRNFDIARLSENDGAALMWWVRNSLFFSLGLSSDSRVRLWSYDAFIREPERELAELLDFLGAEYRSYMLADVHGRSIRKESEPALRPDVRELCQSLYQRLENARSSASRAAPTA